MSLTDKYIVETYSKMLEGLNASSKKQIIKNLTQSLKKEADSNDERFYRSFGAFASNKPAEEIVKEIRQSRKFRRKEIEF